MYKKGMSIENLWVLIFLGVLIKWLKKKKKIILNWFTITSRSNKYVHHLQSLALDYIKSHANPQQNSQTLFTYYTSSSTMYLNSFFTLICRLNFLKEKENLHHLPFPPQTSTMIILFSPIFLRFHSLNLNMVPLRLVLSSQQEKFDIIF